MRRARALPRGSAAAKQSRGHTRHHWRREPRRTNARARLCCIVRIAASLDRLHSIGLNPMLRFRVETLHPILQRLARSELACHEDPSRVGRNGRLLSSPVIGVRETWWCGCGARMCREAQGRVEGVSRGGGKQACVLPATHPTQHLEPASPGPPNCRARSA